MDVRGKIGLRIRVLRQDLKLTQEKLASIAAIDKTYVNEVENGKRNISVINLEKLVIALGTNLHDFFKTDMFDDKV